MPCSTARHNTPRRLRRTAVSRFLPALTAGLALLALTGCGRRDTDERITVYSGRNRHLLQPLLDRFTTDTGIAVDVRYGGTAELAATILEEGRNSPADVFFAQDAGALGALASAGILAPLPADALARVPSRFRSRDGVWVGLSGRARVVVYNPERVKPAELPESIDALTAPHWRDRLGWAPMNASFQSFVTALRVERGEDATREWLAAMTANRPRAYAKNTAIVNAVAAGEVDAGLVNHYYLHTMQREHDGRLKAANHTPAEGALVNVAGIGILATSNRKPAAERFLHYLLDEPAQRYFTEETFEYPLVEDMPRNPALPRLDAVSTPAIDLGQLEDLEGTLALLLELGIL